MQTQVYHALSHYFIFKSTVNTQVIKQLQKIMHQIGQTQTCKILTAYGQQIGHQSIIPQELFLEFLQSIEQSKIKHFQRHLWGKQKSSQLLKQISHINFTQLVTLKLTSIDIDNIEALSWLNAPSLISLQLQANQIISLKPFAKANFPQIMKIQLYVNYFNHQQIQHLNRLQSERLSVLNVSWDVGLIEDKKLHTVDICSSLIKLQSSTIKSTIIISFMIKDILRTKFSDRFHSSFIVRNQYSFVDLRRIAQEMKVN